jgi:hypothetical protein
MISIGLANGRFGDDFDRFSVRMVDAMEVNGARGTYMVKTRLAENRVLLTF